MMSKVRFALMSLLEKAQSNFQPPSLIALPPAVASSIPFGERSASYQPQNKFLRFHSDSPCRTKTIFLGIFIGSFGGNF